MFILFKRSEVIEVIMHIYLLCCIAQYLLVIFFSLIDWEGSGTLEGQKWHHSFSLSYSRMSVLFILICLLFTVV